MTLNYDAESVDGYDIKKDGQDGQGIINFKTGSVSTIDDTKIITATIDSVEKSEITVGGDVVLFTPPNGDTQAGYYGTVASNDFISGDTLASNIGLTAGTGFNSNVDWLKFLWNGGIVMVSKKPIRYNTSWADINNVDAVYGDASAPVVTVNGKDYKVRLMRQAGQDPFDPSTENEVIGAENEWNNLMLPLSDRAPDQFDYCVENNGDGPFVDCPTEDWGIDFTAQDLMVHYDYGNGTYQWGQETDSGNSSDRVYRGGNNISRLNTYPSDYKGDYYGWRPLLERI